MYVEIGKLKVGQLVHTCVAGPLYKVVYVAHGCVVFQGITNPKDIYSDYTGYVLKVG